MDDMIKSIPEEVKRDFIQKTWLSHDARWQMEVVKNFGWEMGNSINHKIARDIGKILMFRMMKILGISQVNNVDELKSMFLSVVMISFPPPDNIYSIEIQNKSSLTIKCQKCSTNDKIRKIGAVDSYECGCFSVRKGFFDALNLTLKEEKQACLIDGDKECQIVMKIREWENSIDIVQKEVKYDFE